VVHQGSKCNFNKLNKDNKYFKDVNDMYKTNSLFFDWSFGSINIRTGKEKSEGARIYMITKEIARKKLLFCSLQEVRYRNNGHKVISLDSG